MLKWKNECHGWIEGALNLKTKGCTLKQLINWILIGKTHHKRWAITLAFAK